MLSFAVADEGIVGKEKEGRSVGNAVQYRLFIVLRLNKDIPFQLFPLRSFFVALMYFFALTQEPPRLPRSRCRF